MRTRYRKGVGTVNDVVILLAFVALVCAIFLFHLRSAFVAIVSLPLGVYVEGSSQPTTRSGCDAVHGKLRQQTDRERSALET